MADYKIPADRATDGAFRSLYDRAEEQIRDLITEAASRRRGERAPTSSASATCTRASWTRTRSSGSVCSRCSTSWRRSTPPPIAAALAAVLGGLQRTGVGGGAGAYIDTDSKDSTRYLLHLSQSGLGLPDESYYRDEQHAEILAAYPRHIAAMFALVYGGTADDHADTAARIVALESKLAAAHWDVVKRRDADLTYNLRTFADLPAEAPGLRLGRLGDGDGHHTGDRSPNSLCANPIT